MADVIQTTIDGSEFTISTSNDWETPPKLFNKLDREFNFTLDPCCRAETAKCKKYFTVEDNGLKKSWKSERVFLNPPYSVIELWMKKVWIEMNTNDCDLVVALLPAWTDRWWFHEFIYPDKAEYRFLQGRVKFLINGAVGKGAPFGSMIAIWNKHRPNYDHCVINARK